MRLHTLVAASALALILVASPAATLALSDEPGLARPCQEAPRSGLADGRGDLAGFILPNTAHMLGPGAGPARSGRALSTGRLGTRPDWRAVLRAAARAGRNFAVVQLTVHIGTKSAPSTGPPGQG